MRGKFITFEGPEGSGKSTQTQLLVERVRRRDIDVVATREPGGTAIGEMLRDIVQHDASGDTIAPATETLLFEASRAQLVRVVIEPALAGGAVVISDRFTDSTTAYQGYGRDCDVDQIEVMNTFATAGLRPDLTVLLDVPVSDGFERLGKRDADGQHGRDRIEKENLEFHEAVRAGYLAIAGQDPGRIQIVDGRDSIDEVHLKIWAMVAALLGICVDEE